MKHMKSYILGLATGTLLIPIAEELLTLISTWIEVAKIKPASIISDWNEKMAAQNDDGELPNAIGFVAPQPEEEYYDDIENESPDYEISRRSSIRSSRNNKPNNK